MSSETRTRAVASPVISVRDVSKSFRVRGAEGTRFGTGGRKRQGMEQRNAVRNVSFQVGRGETVGIIGANGAGKSTLLRMVAGILRPDKGEIEVRGEVTPIIGLGSGFTRELSGLENIFLKAAMLGMKEAEVKTRLDEICAFSGIEDALHRPLRTYSKGMQMRLAFSIAFLRTPEVLIIDETLSVGDEAFRRKSLNRLQEIKAAGATILLVSHAGPMMRNFCDHALLLDQGELLLDSSPDEVVDAYQRLGFATPNERGRVRNRIREQGHGHVALAPGQKAGEALDEAKGVAASRPELEPVERIPPQGARITQCRLQCPNGEEADAVPTGSTFQARCRAAFFQPARDVEIRLAISTMDGARLGSILLSPPGTQDAFVPAGTKLWLKAEMYCPLAAGDYLLSTELFGNLGDGRRCCLHAVERMQVLRVSGPGEQCQGPVDFTPPDRPTTD